MKKKIQNFLVKYILYVFFQIFFFLPLLLLAPAFLKQISARQFLDSSFCILILEISPAHTETSKNVILGFYAKFIFFFTFYLAKLSMCGHKTIQLDWKLHITASYNILDLKFLEFHRKSNFSYNLRIFLCRNLWSFGRFSTSTYNFSWCKYQGRGFWISYSHDNCGKTLRIIFCISAMQGYVF